MTTRSISLVRERIFAPALNPDFLCLLIALLAGAAVLAPAILFGVPDNRDLNNHFRFALPFYDAIRSGNLSPSWLAESNGGYGDPSFRFYPPALYYALSFARLFVGNWYGAALLSFTILSVAGSLGTFLWAKSMLPSRAALFAALFYLLAPYHLNQFYQATLFAEFAASAVIPFVFWSVEKVVQERSVRNIAALGASYGLLLLTHLPLAVIGSIALLVYVVVRVRLNEWRTLLRLAAGALLGLSVSAFYWVTMVSELRWIGINNVQHDASVDYRLNFLFSTFSTENLNVWWMNILTAATLLLFVPALILVKRRGETLVRAVVVVAFFSFFMATPLSRPIWHLVKPLQEVQFPWRWLALFTLFGSIVTASALHLWQSMQTDASRIGRLLVFGCVAIAVAFGLSHIVRESQFLSPTQFETTLSAIRGTDSVNYWIPIWSKSAPKRMEQAVDAPDRSISVSRWDTEDRAFSVSAGTNTQARVRTFYYPHWHADIAGQPLATRPDTDGALLIDIPQQASTVNLRFVEPARTRVAGAASVLGVVLIAALSTPLFRRRSVWEA